MSAFNTKTKPKRTHQFTCVLIIATKQSFTYTYIHSLLQPLSLALSTSKSYNSHFLLVLAKNHCCKN